MERQSCDIVDSSSISDAVLLLQLHGAPAPSIDTYDHCSVGEGYERDPSLTRFEHMTDEQARELIKRAGVTASVEDVGLIAIKSLNFLVLQALTVAEHEHKMILTEEHVLRAMPLFLR